ncbi:MAG TPA: nucleotidyltransferase domain-containing protein [Candidatus Mediterraneibacter merdipullorum]|nr:nucleotidyltransferase domain-containing protein [Candidatus Mediterraneibacter merdipullorum]
MDIKILDELVNGILAIMKPSVVQIVLYGSVARGTNTEESDVDVAIFVKNKMNAEMEDKLSDFVVDMNLKYDKVFSVIDINYETFCKWEGVTPFYQNVAKEGIILWKAA